MAEHLTEMRYFLEVVSAYSSNEYVAAASEMNAQKEILTEEAIVEDEHKSSKQLFEDLTELKQTWLSMTLQDEDEKVADGYEQGLFKAVEMLETLLQTKHDRRI